MNENRQLLNLARSTIGLLVPGWIKSSVPYQRFRGLVVPHDAIYDDNYYKSDVETPAKQAATHVADSIIATFSARSLVDVGCGTGAMLAACRDRGLQTIGLEYSAAGIRRCEERGLEVIRFDIERDTLPIRARYDVALSMEVAEHIPKRCAARFVRLLCDLSPVVVMSAARPGQGGTDHVNLQPKAYWIEKFAENGYSPDVRSTRLLACAWRDNDVAVFYYDNLMVFRED